jgi:hypothetical protein
MAGDVSDTRRFAISTDDLERAINELQDRGGASMYQQAWAGIDNGTRQLQRANYN